VKQQAVIIDLDGTSTLDPRSKNLGKPNEEVIHVVHLLCRWGGFVPIFITGRLEAHRPSVKTFITSLFGAVGATAAIHMRKPDDTADDPAYKLRIYREHIEPQYDTRIVLEDRPSTVAMWRSIGLQCWQVAEGPE
jgi:hypothetical protein